MKLKNKIYFYKGLLIEICETLASICLYLECDARKTHNPEGEHLASHFGELKEYSSELRYEQIKMLGVKKNEVRSDN